MAEAVKMITKAYDLCFSNKFLQAKADIEPWYGNFNLRSDSSKLCLTGYRSGYKLDNV